MGGNGTVCSPLQITAIESVLNQWANAHSNLLVEEANLVELCRRSANSEVTPDVLARHRERVASLRERSEALYAQVMDALQAPS